MIVNLISTSNLKTLQRRGIAGLTSVYFKLDYDVEEGILSGFVDLHPLIVTYFKLCTYTSVRASE